MLLDNFHSNNLNDYLSGFPWHPHRGIETITYVLHGEVEHKDSIGNKGYINSGDVQWMTAGNGIIHQEMPKGQQNGLMQGFQLWANLPASHKMMNPRYPSILSRKIPEIELPDAIKVRIICGKINEVKGPVTDIVTTPEYLDIAVPPKSKFKYNVRNGNTSFAYLIEGSGYFYPDFDKKFYASSEDLVIFENGDKIEISSKTEELRFLLISGKPIGEPIAWYYFN